MRNGERNKNTARDKEREYFTELEDCCVAISCYGGEASRVRGSFVACGKRVRVNLEG